MQDKLEKERNDAKNAVEEYVYDFRDKLGTVYEKFITQEVSLNFTILELLKHCLETANTNYVNVLNALLAVLFNTFRNAS